MKKITKALILAAALLLLSGCGQQVSQEEYIGLDAAKVLALEAAGVANADADFTTTGLDRRDGVDYYAVDFTANGQTYEYDIDAITGVIIDSSSAPVQQTGGTQTIPDGNSGTQVPVTPPADSGTGDSGTVNSSTVNNSGTNTGTASGSITAAEAKSAALAHAGLTESQVTFVKTELDWEDGRQVYEVEFYTGDYKEYDYEIDASTGQVISYDYDAENYLPPASSGSTGLTADQAKALALEQVPGATTNDIYEFETDYDDGRIEYEGKIIYGGMEYEFEIDGYSGSIRNWEAEPTGRW